MAVLHTDLDNTLIYSYKRDIGAKKKQVERYQGRAVSFATDKTLGLLQKLRARMLIVPTTTRTIEQYKRIDLGIGEFKYALVCNGGILLVDGKRDEHWYQESIKSISYSRSELEKAQGLLERDPRRCFELRFIERLFLFTKCTEAETVVQHLTAELDMSMVDVLCHGEKVYVVPKNLNKGRAVRRFHTYIQADYVIAAGDSAFDSPMLMEADLGLAPFGYGQKFRIASNIQEMDENQVFSDAYLEACMQIAQVQY